jgi:NAD(P)-dependent dehydrogenase (short-subunit alcohol dehydrogenase family)
VYIASRKLKQLEESARELNAIASEGGICKILVADLTSKQKCQELAGLLAAQEKKLHVLVNNAGMSWASPLEDFDEKNGWDRLMALNVKAGFYLTAW